MKSGERGIQVCKQFHIPHLKCARRGMGMFRCLIAFGLSFHRAIRREAFQKVGLLDGRMFCGWEDAGYCVRMHRAGYQVFYYPDATMIHHEQRTTKKRVLNRLALDHLKAMVLFFAKYPSGMWGKYL